jgi:hypothetical protein
MAVVVIKQLLLPILEAGAHHVVGDAVWSVACLPACGIRDDWNLNMLQHI